MRYKHINLVYVKIIVNNQYIERIMMGWYGYLLVPDKIAGESDCNPASSRRTLKV